MYGSEFAASDWGRVHESIRRLRSFRGALLACGGGQDPQGQIRPHFMHLAGGHAARIAVVPVASRRDDTRGAYYDIFKALGAAEVWMVDPDRSQANDPRIEWALRHASGICLTGGDQKLLVDILGDSLGLRSLYQSLLDGIPMYTTSAGTVALSDPMVAGLLEDDSLRIERGLGILPGITFETHVNTRGRHHRLDHLVARRLNPLVMGVDENTTLVFHPGTSTGTVIGSGEVVVMAEFGPAREPRWYKHGDTLDVASFLP